MTEEGNSLSAIRAKEQEINDRLEQTRSKAAALIEAAHQSCRNLADEARAKAKSDSESTYSKELEDARNEAQIIRDRIPAEIESINSNARNHLDEVASTIVSQVIPGSAS